MKRIVAEIDRTGLVCGRALLLDLLVLREQITVSIGSAACLERANFELILCVAPPAEWQIALSGALARDVVLRRRFETDPSWTGASSGRSGRKSEIFTLTCARCAPDDDTVPREPARTPRSG